jgi:type IV pilus modification protein PilV
MIMNTGKGKGNTKRIERGYTLIEVLIGIVIFAIGMLALAQLQTNLAKNSSDASARTVATNIAEEQIEQARVFGQIPSDGSNAAYNDIVTGTETITRSGNSFTVNTVVSDYYYDSDTESFTTTAPAGAARSDFKRMDVTVTWNSGSEFHIDQDATTTGRLDSGSITISDVISSITSPSGGKVALAASGDSSVSPPVDYSPGDNPDIISIQLGDNKFKESTTPLPDVIRSEELVETRFDVVTYSQNDSGATFLRREEFRAVSCECTLQFPDTGEEGGLRPTIWNGNDYTEGEFVSKPYGLSANNQQSGFCDICCRDHHDGGTGSEDLGSDPGKSRYNPFRSTSEYHTTGSLAGDHKHYKLTGQGALEVADSEGDIYLEACRMVRRDGFFRIAQDLRQEGLNAFPADYLDDESEVSVYSGYVTTAVSAFEAEMGGTNLYEFYPPSLVAPGNLSSIGGIENNLSFPASTEENASEMNYENGITEQQMRSRGIYIDYMSDELRTRINCLDILPEGGDSASCEVPNVSSALEIIPFYDVQLTWLSRWTESPHNEPIDVTNEAVADNNTHDRGMASLTNGYGPTTVNIAVHTGNLGLTGTDPIDLNYGLDLEDYDLHAIAIENVDPPEESGYFVSGQILSSVNGVKAADVEIYGSDAACDRTNTGYECFITTGTTNARMKVDNYFKANKTLIACSAVLATHGNEHVADNGVGNWTRFNLGETATNVADIVIKENSCD